MYAPNVRILRGDDGFQSVLLPLLVHGRRGVCCGGGRRGGPIVAIVAAAPVGRSGRGRDRWRYRRCFDLLLGMWLHLEKRVHVAVVMIAVVCG